MAKPQTSELDARSPWENVLSPQRPPFVLAIVVLAATLVQGLVDPIAFIIGSTEPWPNAIPFELSVALLLVFYVAQSAALLLTSRWPAVALGIATALYVVALFTVNAPTWVTPMQLAIVAALFLLAVRRPIAYLLVTLVLVTAVLAGTFVGWTRSEGLPLGVAAGFIVAQSAGLAAILAAATVLGLWWGAQTRRVTQMRAQAEAERQEQAERLERARELERARIAQELHDVAAQHIAGLVSLTDAALSIADDNPRDAVELLAEVRAEGRFAAASLYGALSELRATGQARAETTPGARDIGELVDFWRRRDADVQFHTTGDPSSLPAVISATAYRIAQEALTNAAKHAPSAPVEVAVDVTGDELVVRVVNQPGRLSVAERPGSGLGWGLSGLEERVQLLGGSFHARETDQGGWQVLATIPLDVAPEPAS